MPHLCLGFSEIKWAFSRYWVSKNFHEEISDDFKNTVESGLLLTFFFLRWKFHPYIIEIKTLISFYGSHQNGHKTNTNAMVSRHNEIAMIMKKPSSQLMGAFMPFKHVFSSFKNTLSWIPGEMKISNLSVYCLQISK